ncbi:EamA family transporter [Patescibacteria group bacterium]|jgi:drug/metabolite transporter (DMT)-like permease|nr:EamA family transporter [Patescibacteria group bacterium]
MLLWATLGGLTALVGFGVADYLAGKSGKDTDPFLANLALQAAALISWLLVVPFVSITQPSWFALGVSLAIGTLFTVAMAFYIKALDIGPFGVVAPLANSYAGITLILGVWWFGAMVSGMEIALLALIVTGVFLLAADRTTFSLGNFHRSSVAIALVPLVAWGVAFALLDLLLAELAWYEMFLWTNLGAMLAGIVLYLLVRRRVPSVASLTPGAMPLAWLAGVWIFLGASGIYVGADRAGSAVVPAVIASASPLVTALLSAYRDHERLTWVKRAGALIIVAGVALLNVG